MADAFLWITISIPSASTITIDTPIHLLGYNANGNDGSSVVVDAGRSNRCFDVGAVACEIEDFTLQNGATPLQGYTPNAGGGIPVVKPPTRAFIIAPSPIAPPISVEPFKRVHSFIVPCSNNVATQGGAAYQSNLDGCTISSNSATYGGGVYGGDVIKGCTLSNNSASSQGGGGYNSILTNSTLVAKYLRKSRAAERMAVRWTSVLSPTIRLLSAGDSIQAPSNRSFIANNHASIRGGGSDGGTAHNCTYSWNTAIEKGGGTYGTRLYNCTVVSNAADVAGGSYGNYAYNSIFWDNFAWTDTPNIQTVYLYNSCSPRSGPRTLTETSPTPRSLSPMRPECSSEAATTILATCLPASTPGITAG